MTIAECAELPRCCTHVKQRDAAFSRPKGTVENPRGEPEHLSALELTTYRQKIPSIPSIGS
jgi:hypothetical protein